MTPSDWAVIVGVVVGQSAAFFGLLQWQRKSLETWVRELYVRQSDFARLEGKVEAIEHSVSEVKRVVERIYSRIVGESG